MSGINLWDKFEVISKRHRVQPCEVRPMGTSLCGGGGSIVGAGAQAASAGLARPCTAVQLRHRTRSTLNANRAARRRLKATSRRSCPKSAGLVCAAARALHSTLQGLKDTLRQLQVETSACFMPLLYWRRVPRASHWWECCKNGIIMYVSRY